LVEKSFLSPAERDKAQTTLEAASAQVQLAEAQVKNSESVVRQREALVAQAHVDLGRTELRSPVDGVVVKRSVEPGQTVAASLQAPEMFVIAQNLSDMQVETSIDEADVGRVQLGQKASFTVDAFPDRNFHGEVRQVRKAATVVSNVVTYTVIVSAANPELTLLPGMTANVRIVTAQKDSALKVANAALRFKPDNDAAKVSRGVTGGNPRGSTAPDDQPKGRGRAQSRIYPRPLRCRPASPTVRPPKSAAQASAKAWKSSSASMRRRSRARPAGRACSDAAHPHHRADKELPDGQHDRARLARCFDRH